MTVDIDSRSGFCAGVIRAITKAEECLAKNSRLYSLGAIVHNDAELRRLEDKGMVVISDADLENMPDACGGQTRQHLLIRAHGAPPKTYETLHRKGLLIEDCTCPVVLKLQQDIRASWDEGEGKTQIIIFGKVGHAEVLGLLGQIDGKAPVIENLAALDAGVADGRIDLRKRTVIFSQTTKNPDEYAQVCGRLAERMSAAAGLSPEDFSKSGMLTVKNTICSQVATRHAKLAEFASDHDVIIFVAGKASSNGKVLCDLCRQHNPKTWHIESAEDIDQSWFRPSDKVGVCGATSTPKWLLEQVAQKILQLED